MSDDIRKFLSQSGSSDPVFRFKSVGDEICGKIAEEPKLLPQKKYQSDEPKLDDDGNPVMELLLVLDTEQGRCRVYVDRPLQKTPCGVPWTTSSRTAQPLAAPYG